MRGPRIPSELWDILYFLSIAALLTDLLLKDLLPWPVGAILLTGAVAFRAFARAVGGVSDRIYWRFRIAFFLLALIPLLIRGIPLQSLPAVLCALLFHGLERILVSILSMGAQGELPFWGALVIAVALLLISRSGLEIGSAFLYRIFFCLLAPLFTLALMLAWWSQGDWQQAALVGGSVFSVFLFAEGAYLILRGFMARP